MQGKTPGEEQPPKAPEESHVLMHPLFPNRSGQYSQSKTNQSQCTVEEDDGEPPHCRWTGGLRLRLLSRHRHIYHQEIVGVSYVLQDLQDGEIVKGCQEVYFAICDETDALNIYNLGLAHQSTADAGMNRQNVQKGSGYLAGVGVRHLLHHTARRTVLLPKSLVSA